MALKNSSYEWRWALVWALVALALSILPTLWGLLATPPGSEFGGFLFNATDGNTYLNKMEQGREGSWLFHLAYTPEKGGEGAFIFVPYLLLGKLAGLLGIPNLAMYHLSRLTFGFALLLASYYFICLLFERRELQRLAFLLLCFSSGLGWLTSPLGVHSPDFWVSESLTFFSIYANPHFPLATLLLVLTLTWAYFGLDGRPLYYLAAAGTAFLMGFVHPFLLFTLAGVLGVYWLRLVIEKWRSGEERGINRGQWLSFLALIGVGLAGTPGPLITLMSTSSDVLLKDWMAQNQTPSLDPLTTASGYGIILPLAAIGWWLVEKSFWSKTKSPGLWMLVTTWAAITPLLIYLPVSFSRRLIEGWHLPLVCLATLGWAEVIWPWLKKKFPKLNFNLMNARLIIFCGISTLILLVISVALLFLHKEDLYEPVLSPYLSAGEVGAFQWLSKNSGPDDVVLTAPVLGNYLPSHAPNRVFYGHLMETIDSEKKLGQLESFFASENSAFVPMTQPQRNDIIKRWGLKYLLYGWRERKLGNFDPSKTGWPLVYENDDVRIYKLS